MENLQAGEAKSAGTVGGVCALLRDESAVQFFTLGSASRGISHRRWKIALPVDTPERYAFYPGADVIAFIELRRVMCVPMSWGPSAVSSFRRNSYVGIEIHLRAMSDGGHHPAAQYPSIRYQRRGTDVSVSSPPSITSSRLAVVAIAESGDYLVVFDWKSAQVLFVRQLFL